MAVSARRVAFATAASLAVYWLLKSFLHAPHPALLPAAAALVAVAVGAGGKRGGPGAPPGPAAVPVFGNWLQVGNDLNHRFLARLSARYGPVFRLRLGVRNLVVVSDPRLATEVLHTQGVEFGSRPRNVVFDARFDSVDDPMFVEATKFNSERSRLAQSFDYNYGDFIPILRPFLRGYLNKCRDLQTRRLAFFNSNYVEKRREVMDTPGQDKNKLRCAIDHILAAEKSGEITPENVIYIVENINVAAIETTLWSIEWALAEVVNHPDVQRKVRGEIRDVLGDDEPITESNISKLPYLQAVIKETLRLHSPIPLLVPHMNLEEASLGGYTIPKGSKVVVNAWWLANNPELWEKPEEFKPERFLGEESNVDATVGGKVDFRFLPFGVGRRSCPGIILALPILALIVGKLVRSFEMVPPPGVDKLDVSEKGGQFSLHIANHSVVAFHPISP
ncbi:unnamed protein product [Triticum turgidum subsp. durum]|uniref:Cinnamate 4-hydroxylase n=1 Tax=Triticum turgidum subsp. durum TaxID=4567 RepID=A0A9R1BRR1_TRITD|nr:unnamed protein product [Triticum turgidum subsp. durum]